MPIRPELRRFYLDPHWLYVVRPTVLDRARGPHPDDPTRIVVRCECQGQCGYDHGGRCSEVDGEPAREMNPRSEAFRVRIAVCHLLHSPVRNRPEHCRAQCEACHLRTDVHRHLAVRIWNRDAQRRQYRLFAEWESERVPFLPRADFHLARSGRYAIARQLLERDRRRGQRRLFETVELERWPPSRRDVR